MKFITINLRHKNKIATHIEAGVKTHTLTSPMPVDNNSLTKINSSKLPTEYKYQDLNNEDDDANYKAMDIQPPELLRKKYGSKLSEGIDVKDTSYTIYAFNPDFVSSSYVDSTYCINCRFLILFDKETEKEERIYLYKKNDRYEYEMTPYEIGNLRFQFLFTKKELGNSVTSEVAPNVTQTQKKAFGLFYYSKINPVLYYDETIKSLQKR